MHIHERADQVTPCGREGSGNVDDLSSAEDLANDDRGLRNRFRDDRHGADAAHP